MIRHKKSLGQHFLREPQLARKIVDQLESSSIDDLLIEVGPGPGILSSLLMERYPDKYMAIEVDRSVLEHLSTAEAQIAERVLLQDFTKTSWEDCLDFTRKTGLQITNAAMIGNFPYQISSQILFKVLDWRLHISQVVGMLQKEVAQRICASPGGKDYGILSVLIQAYFKTRYLFDVHEQCFDPPPKVKSGVFRLDRLDSEPDVPFEQLKTVVKQSFNFRRKTLRNSLKSLIADKQIDDTILSRRPEQLNVAEFVELTQYIYAQNV